MTQTKISKAFQTTISAEAIRALGLRPGQRLNQFVEGNRLVMEPAEDVDSLAGSLATGKRAATIQEIKAAAKAGFVRGYLRGMNKEK